MVHPWHPLMAMLLLPSAALAGLHIDPPPPGLPGGTIEAPASPDQGTRPPDQVHLTHDHLTQPPGTTGFVLPDNTPRAQLSLTLSPREPRQPCLSLEASVTVTSPQGTQLHLGGGGRLGAGPGSCGSTSVVTLEPEPGRWEASFEGRGLARSTVTVMPLDAT